MAEITVPYGKSTLAFCVPSNISLEILQPKEMPAVPDQRAEVERALDNPRGGVRLEDFRSSRHVVIVVSDKTRSVPHGVILPPLLERLERLGIRASDITLLIATGAHKPMSPDEFGKVLPSGILDHYQVISHDATAKRTLQKVGITSRGTPLWINKRYLEADVRIVTGNIEPHQFAGFAGGAKSIVIGLGGIATIQANHSMMSHPAAKMGVYHGNPVREDIDEGGRLVGISFAVNTVLNSKGKIARAFAGTVDEVQKRGVIPSSNIARVEVSEEADIVITSPGGYPKDINLYQSQKALAHASRIVKEGGTVIVVAECVEGVGNDLYERWMKAASCLDDVFERFQREGFTLGAHKAFLWARDMAKTKVYLVSSLKSSLVRELFLKPAASVNEVLDLALERHGPATRVAVMPKAISTVPLVKGQDV